MRKQPKNGLEGLARHLGKRDRPDWRAAAEFLAATYCPDILDGEQSSKAGRPGKNNGLYIFRDVRAVMWLVRQTGGKCSIKQACQMLAKGKLPKREPRRLRDGTWLIPPAPSSRWVGQNARSLRQRYFDAARNLRKPPK